MSTARAALPYDAWAVAAPGLEPLVAAELRQLGVSRIAPETGGVSFRCDALGLARAQLSLRVASRVVVRLASFRATTFRELEREARRVEWGRFCAEGAAVRLRVTCRKSKLYHSDAVAERVGAAIARAVPAARLESADGDEDTELGDDSQSPIAAAAAAEPPQIFVIRLDHDQCTISADASGELLHRRGYRQAVGRAPLRETLAAAMLAAVEWDTQTPLVDPLCGAGTIAIEAATRARRIAPGLGRRFAAERWPESDASDWAAARATARRRILPAAPAPILGSDRDAGAIEAARANAERAGVAADIAFAQRALSALEVPEGPGLLVANPPYGVRVGDPAALRDLFARFGQVARERCAGWRVALLSADRALDAATALPFREILQTSNGGIAVRLVVADLENEKTKTRTRSRTPG
ncbi:MAG: THUMP domain-containing protein [Gemmatimonadaceae bacterium]